ncbi:MAG: hypothetical protein ACD_18C00002G0005 [uncultured bacterium]|nr:MAG: hypothetical protein ACD_18C00002G0005 [uncultured bacterium]OGH90877.1 MAG: hypothetical protein A2507_01510 [Candidatus Magasanikbacteria bacterium RIFOXYD12_FULL_33_17]HAO52322.1 hypothetical protein [Candidatus Magasanikbacteria bacterium]
MTDISKERNNLHFRIWMLMIRIIFIFGIPAGIGFFVGKYLDERFSMRPKATVITLLLTFVLSWFITVFEYGKITKKLKALDEKEELEEKSKKNSQDNNL